MDQAIYEPTTQKIFGVRGQWVFKFNSVTGALEDTLRFAANTLGPSSIVALGGNLYIGTTFSPDQDLSGLPTFTDADVYVVNAAAFVLTGRFNWGVKNSASSNEPYRPGWRHMVTDGTNIYGFNFGMVVTVGPGLWSVNPTNLATFNAVNATQPSDIFCDTSNSALWIADNSALNLFAVSFNFLSSCFDTTGTIPMVGVTFNTATQKMYGVAGDFRWFSGSAAGVFPGYVNFAITPHNSGIINANPFRIKSVNLLPFNPLNGKVIMPCWNDDTVVVINPATDTQFGLARTGFKAPFDVVSTPFTNWAVQSGVTGLKEII